MANCTNTQDHGRGPINPRHLSILSWLHMVNFLRIFSSRSARPESWARYINPQQRGHCVVSFSTCLAYASNDAIEQIFSIRHAALKTFHDAFQAECSCLELVGLAEGKCRVYTRHFCTRLIRLSNGVQTKKSVYDGLFSTKTLLWSAASCDATRGAPLSRLAANLWLWCSFDTTYAPLQLMGLVILIHPAGQWRNSSLRLLPSPTH